MGADMKVAAARRGQRTGIPNEVELSETAHENVRQAQ